MDQGRSLVSNNGGMHVGFEEKMQEIKGYLRRIELLGNAMGS